MIDDKEGKNVVFPSLWLAVENQGIDFPYFFINSVTLCQWAYFWNHLL
jgi:hypothetical protein